MNESKVTGHRVFKKNKKKKTMKKKRWRKSSKQTNKQHIDITTKIYEQ